MPKVKVLQSNFSSGELSPQASGRVDITRYPNAAKTLSNVISRTLGGAQKRAGLQYVAPAKSAAARSRLVPYIVSRDQAYMLELGNTYLRVFKTDGTQVESSPGVPYEIASPYDTDQAQEIDYSQGEDTMYVFHEDVYPQRLRTFGDTKWDLSSAPFTTTPFAELGDYPAAALTLSSNTVGTGRTMTAGASVFMASDVGRAILHKAGVAIITGYTSGTQVTVEVKVVFDSTSIPSGEWNLDSSPQATLTPSAATPVGASITLTLSADGWRAGTAEIGKYVKANGGLVKITGYTSATQVSAKIIKVLTSATAVPATAWTLESSVWGGINGYPRTGTLHEQRLVTAGSPGKPQTVWGSRTGEPLDYTLGTADDDGYAFTLMGNNNQVNPINYIVSSRNLLVLTHGGESSMQSGIEKPITPTNVQIKSQSPHGAGRVKPVQVSKETLFVQRAKRKLRAMGYRYDEDGYKSPDLTTLAEHITETGVVQIAFQQEPDPIIWVVLANGRLVSLTLDRELDVVAWNRHETDGAFESVAVVQAGDTDQVWFIVRRDINGSIVRYVERLQPSWYPIHGTASPDPDTFPPGDEPTNWGFQLDSAITQDDAVGKATWDGLDHLEGEAVQCLADGVDMGEFTVTGGEITLPRTAKRTLIGLYFRPEVVMLTPEIQLGAGSSQADAMSTNEVVIRVLDTLGVTVNGSLTIPGRNFGPDVLDAAPELYSGDKAASVLGWQRGKAEVTISQDGPFPFHLLAVIRSITINGG